MDILNTKIVSRNDISSNWTRANPILLLGEIGVETDTNKLKVGNGVNNWNDLPYMMGDNKLTKQLTYNEKLLTKLEELEQNGFRTSKKIGLIYSIIYLFFSIIMKKF